MIHRYSIKNCSDEKSMQRDIYLFSQKGYLQLGKYYCSFNGSYKISRWKSYKRKVSSFFFICFAFENFSLIIGFEFQKP